MNKLIESLKVVVAGKVTVLKENLGKTFGGSDLRYILEHQDDKDVIATGKDGKTYRVEKNGETKFDITLVDTVTATSYATPPDDYAKMMDAWEKFKATVRVAQPKIHRNYLSKIRELTVAMDGVTDALADLGDEVDD